MRDVAQILMVRFSSNSGLQWTQICKRGPTSYGFETTAQPESHGGRPGRSFAVGSGCSAASKTQFASLSPCQQIIQSRSRFQYRVNLDVLRATRACQGKPIIESYLFADEFVLSGEYSRMGRHCCLSFRFVVVQGACATSADPLQTRCAVSVGRWSDLSFDCSPLLLFKIAELRLRLR
jgi:hypothetical protein